ncbi:MAG: hypothetical protein JXB88_03880 [Spirochaetales bacterium]|nr:hypothetical protein [Spirochaetales bacterium]
MKRKAIIISLIFLILSMSTYADFQFDVGLTVPAYIGITTDSGEGIGEMMKYLFIIPDLQLHYIFDLGIIKFGAGIRAYTLVVESILMPSLIGEVNLYPFVISASLFGGGYLFFGLLTQAGATELAVFDANIAYRFTDWFRLGAGGMVLTEFSSEYDLGAYPYILYVFGKFSFNF